MSRATLLVLAAAGIVLVVGTIVLGVASHRRSHGPTPVGYAPEAVEAAFARAGLPLERTEESDHAVHLSYVPGTCSGSGIGLSVTVLKPGTGAFTDLELLPAAPRGSLHRRNVAVDFAMRCVAESRVAAVLAALPARPS